MEVQLLIIMHAGTIAHGRRIELKHELSPYDPIQSVEQIFDSFGGTKQLCSVEVIKEELMKRGPVVSVSFSPNQAFMSSNQMQSSHNKTGGNKSLVERFG